MIQQSLFQQNDSLDPLNIPDADVRFLSRFDFGMSENVLFERIRLETPWLQETVSIWGKKYPQPRLVAWYGQEGADYAYSGITLNPLPWTELLLVIKEKTEGVVGQNFNSVLLNLYRNENDSMGFHSDDEPELGPRPTIASISLGEARTFIFKHRRNKGQKDFKVELTSGSLLVMSGETQKNWKHGIPKERRPRGSRINLTFRNIRTI